MMGGQGQEQALKTAWGSFLGFMAASGIKVIVALILCWYYGTELIRWVTSSF